jgi:cathepsin L
MNALLLVLVGLLAISQALTEEEYRAAFYKWQQQYNKVYPSFAESNYRLTVFRQNLDFVNAHDEKAKGYSVALNQFADMTSAEFTAWANGMNVTAKPNKSFVRSSVDAKVPSTWDWRSKGAVTGVKNQAQCGSCWSFSATGSTEGATFLKTGRLPSLSEQNLVDCSVPQGNQGCNGGLMDQAFQYIISNRGIDTEASYPYTATGPNSCKFNRNNVAATLSSFHDIPQGDENALLNAVYKTPVSVAIDASHQSFQFYSSGVYYEAACSSTSLDHGVLAVGFGNEGGHDYWLVKNSWGTGWGSAGYIKMSRNRNNNCGIATAASYPIV